MKHSSRTMRTLKIATYNIWGFNEPWHYTVNRRLLRGAVPGSIAATSRSPDIWPRRCKLIVDAFNKVQPDIIGLQEVREFPDRPGLHQAEQIAHDLSYHCVFIPTIGEENNREHFVQGLAVLARFEMKKTHVIRPQVAASAPNWQQSLLHAVIDTQPKALHLVVCHLTPRSEDAQLTAVEDIYNILQLSQPINHKLSLATSTPSPLHQRFSI